MSTRRHPCGARDALSKSQSMSTKSNASIVHLCYTLKQVQEAIDIFCRESEKPVAEQKWPMFLYARDKAPQKRIENKLVSYEHLLIFDREHDSYQPIVIITEETIIEAPTSESSIYDGAKVTFDNPQMCAVIESLQMIAKMLSGPETVKNFVTPSFIQKARVSHMETSELPSSCVSRSDTFPSGNAIVRAQMKFGKMRDGTIKPTCVSETKIYSFEPIEGTFSREKRSLGASEATRSRNPQHCYNVQYQEIRKFIQRGDRVRVAIDLSTFVVIHQPREIKIHQRCEALSILILEISQTAREQAQEEDIIEKSMFSFVNPQELDPELRLDLRFVSLCDTARQPTQATQRDERKNQDDPDASESDPSGSSSVS